MDGSELDLQAAANRLAHYDLGNFQGPTGDEADMRAGIVLAKAYLVDHDEKPIDHVWLNIASDKGQRTFGDSDKYDGKTITVVMCYSGDEMRKGLPGRWHGVINGGEYRSAIPVPTRGSLRRLAALLGIDLKEEPDAAPHP